MSKNGKKIVQKFQEIWKIRFFSLTKSCLFLKKILKERKYGFWKKNSIIFLVLPFKKINICPELSSPPRFIIQGVYPEHKGQSPEILVSNIGFLAVTRVFDWFDEIAVHTYTEIIKLSKTGYDELSSLTSFSLPSMLIYKGELLFSSVGI